MNPEPSEGEVMIRDGIRRFLEAEAPLADRKAHPAESESGTGTAPGAREFWRRAAAVGVTSLLVPEAFGGAGMDRALPCLAVVSEEFGRLAAPGPLLPCNVVADTLARSGTAQQKEQWLNVLASGDCVATWAMGEPGDRWLTESISLQASRRDGEWVLDGVKFPVETGPETDLLLVSAVDAAEGAPMQFLVPVPTEGVEVVPLRSLDLSRTFARIRFDRVRLPESAVVSGPEGPAVDIERQIDLAIALQAAETATIMQVVLDGTVAYLQDRYAFGRPVASYQAIKHRLAEHKVWVETALGVSSAVIEALGLGDPAGRGLASAAKVHMGEQSLTTLSDCSQLLGGISMTWEHEHHVFFRRVTVNRSVYGPPAVHRERLCRLAGL